MKKIELWFSWGDLCKKETQSVWALKIKRPSNLLWVIYASTEKIQRLISREKVSEIQNLETWTTIT